MNNINRFELKISAIKENESFVRHLVGDFILSVNPTVEELEDVKTAVSEAVTNSIVHAYDDENGEVIISCSLFDRSLEIIVSDTGKGIKNIKQAVEPFFTTKADEEHSGMGFTLMQSFMSSLDITSHENKGTTIVMTKVFSQEEDNARAQ